MSLMAETRVEFKNKRYLRQQNATKVMLQSRIRTNDYESSVAKKDTIDGVLRKENKHVIKIKLIKPQLLSQVERYTNSEKQSRIEKRGIDLVAMAKRASDAVSANKLLSTHPDFVLAVNALSTLKFLPVPTDSVRFTRDLKCLESLTNHPMLKIRTEAANVINLWKTSEPLLTNKPKAKQSCDFRDKVRGHLLEALSKAITEIDRESAKGCDPVQMAATVESIMYKKSMGQSNMAKQRSILFNLNDPKNPELRKRVLLGEIKPEGLVEMTAEEMASSKRKRENDEIRLKRLFGNTAIRNKHEQGTTEEFECGKCAQRRCTYCQIMQTTSDANEHFITFVRCLVCSNRCKF